MSEDYKGKTVDRLPRSNTPNPDTYKKKGAEAPLSICISLYIMF